MMADHDCRVTAQPRALIPVTDQWAHATALTMWSFSVCRCIPKARWLAWALAAAAAGVAGCGPEEEARDVELTTQRLAAEEVVAWGTPAVESGDRVIRVRQVFTARGPCRGLEAQVMRRFPGEYMLRVVAHELDVPCGDDSPHIGYVASLRGLPQGRHELRIVHVGADGSTLAETVLEHPILVTDRRDAP